MTAEWHITRQGKQYGPFTEEKLRELAAAKRLSPVDLIWRQGMAQWVAAGSVPAIFPRREHPSTVQRVTVPASRTTAGATEREIPVINVRAKPRGVYRTKKTNRMVYSLVAAVIPLALIATVVVVLLGTGQPASRKQRSAQAKREEPASSGVVTNRIEVEEASASENISAQAELRERIISNVCEVSVTYAIEQRGELVSKLALASGLSGDGGMGPYYLPNRPAMLIQLRTELRNITNGVPDESAFESLVKTHAQAWVMGYVAAPISGGRND